jgi:coenzyme F420-reducing hydrogenase alpha subunit
MKSRKIKVAALARVEGEGAIYLTIKDGKATDVKFNIYEPPRFFEALLRGREYSEAPDITARICGICPVAYQMSAVHAMENAFGVKVDGPLRALRRLIYCGEWIESHTLHVFMLHAPDFLGYESAIHMAKDHPDVVKNALRLKKTGNALVTTVGGREIHPVNVRVGGFYRAPGKKELYALLDELKWGRDWAVESMKLLATLTFPDFERDYDFVALRHPDEYPFNEGRIASGSGLDMAVNEYENHFEEEHVAHSNALRSTMKGRGAYKVGPLARYSLNFDRLPQVAQEAARMAGLGPVVKNPFKSIIVRMVETVFALDEAVKIIESYEKPDAPCVKIEPKASVGYASTEAPRGILWHKYKVDEQGLIRDAKIVPPTSQNQRIIEEDLAAYAELYADLPDDKLTWRLEQAVRNYDPCISCATHMVRVKVERE